MEAYTGRGLYSASGKRAPSSGKLEKETVIPQRPPTVSHAENFVKVQVDPPKVRTVEEILEQTRCILPHEFASVAPSEMEISRDSPIMAESVSKMVKYQGNTLKRSYSLESGLSSLSALNSLLCEIDADHVKFFDMEPRENTDDLMNEINNIYTP